MARSCRRLRNPSARSAQPARAVRPIYNILSQFGISSLDIRTPWGVIAEFPNTLGSISALFGRYWVVLESARATRTPCARYPTPQEPIRAISAHLSRIFRAADNLRSRQSQFARNFRRDRCLPKRTANFSRTLGYFRTKRTHRARLARRSRAIGYSRKIHILPARFSQALESDPSARAISERAGVSPRNMVFSKNPAQISGGYSRASGYRRTPRALPGRSAIAHFPRIPRDLPAGLELLAHISRNAIVSRTIWNIPERRARISRDPRNLCGTP